MRVDGMESVMLMNFNFTGCKLSVCQRDKLQFVEQLEKLEFYVLLEVTKEMNL